jgi:tetratricopeptide (TPR) repeat protein
MGFLVFILIATAVIVAIIVIKKRKEKAMRVIWEAENEKLEQSAKQGDKDATYQLGIRHRNMGNPAEAEKWFTIAAACGHEEAKKILADIAAEQKAKEDAGRIALDKADKLSHEHKWKEALVYYNQAIYLLPSSAYAYHSRGLAYSILEKYYEAIADFDKCLDLKPNDKLASQAFTYRGVTDEAIGDVVYSHNYSYTKARSDYEKAVELDPDNKSARQYLKELGDKGKK